MDEIIPSRLREEEFELINNYLTKQTNELIIKKLNQ